MFSQRNFPRPFFYVFTVFLLLFVLGLTGIFRPVRGFLEKTVVIPLKQKVYFWQRTFKKDIGACVLQSEKEIDESKIKIASLQEENTELRRLLSAPLPKNWQFLSAKVIGIEGESLLVDVGARDGIVRGVVVASGATYVGRIEDVSERISKIKMPSFWEEKLTVKIIDKESGQITGRGLLVGRGTGRMNIEQILSSEWPKKGDLVMVSLEGGDLLVGEIEEVVEKKGEAFKNAVVKRLFNPEELSTVFLIRGKI